MRGELTGKVAFHADTVAGDAADCEAGVIARAACVEHNAFELLNTFAVAFLLL